MAMKNTGVERPERAAAPHDDWRNLIRASEHEDEVLTLVRDHMARWSPEEIARLPHDCRPGRIRDAHDVSQWAYQLASNHCAGNARGEDEATLERMLEFVTQAAIRLSELKSAPAEGNAD
jgi:hypothetical protein